MKWPLRWVGVGALLASFGLAVPRVASGDAAVADWTVLVYAAHDNNLETSLYGDLVEMGKHSGRVKFMVYVERAVDCRSRSGGACVRDGGADRGRWSTIDIPDVPLDPVVTTTVPPTTTVAPLVNPADLTGESVDLGGVPVSTPTGFVVLSEGETNAVVQRGESVAAFAVYPKSQIGNSAANKLSEYVESTVADVLVNVKSGQVTPVAVNGFVDAASVELRASTHGTNTPVYAHVTVAVAPDGKVWTLEYSTSTGTSLSRVKTELQQLFAGFFGAAAKGNVVID